MRSINNRSEISFPLKAPSNNQSDTRSVEQQEANPKKAEEQADEQALPHVRPGQSNLQRFLAVHGKTGKTSSEGDTSVNAELVSREFGEMRMAESEERGSSSSKPDEHEVGSTSRFRYYSSGSEASDPSDSDVSELSWADSSDSDEDTCDNPLLRLEKRFERKTAELFQGRESILSEHRQLPFDQTDLIRKIVPDKESRPLGICFGLSLEWLNASHAHPAHSAQATIQFISQDEQARRAIDTQRISLKLTDEIPLNHWHRLKESIEKSELNGIRLGKYRKVDNDSDLTPLSDIGIEAAHLLQRSGPHTLIAMETNRTGHAIACVRKNDGSFSLFDPDSGAYEVSSEMLPNLLAGVFATHMVMVNEQLRKDAASDEAAASFLQNNGPLKFRKVFVFPVSFPNDSYRDVSGLAPAPQDTISP